MTFTEGNWTEVAPLQKFLFSREVVSSVENLLIREETVGTNPGSKFQFGDGGRGPRKLKESELIR